jgi:hypothetical protein
MEVPTEREAPPVKRFSVTSNRGIPFRVILTSAEEYTRRTGITVSNPIVEFYDARRMVDSEGKFVQSYYVDTVLDGDGGLALYGDQPNWWLDAATMDAVRAWLTTTTA